MNNKEIKALTLRIIWIICAISTGIFLVLWAIAPNFCGNYGLLALLFSILTSFLTSYLIERN